MQTAALGFVMAALASLCWSPLIRGMCRRLDLVDRPDGRRKVHAQPTALGGGISVFLATVVVLAALVALGWPGGSFPWLKCLSVLAASGLIVGLGVIDDFGRLRGRQKLLGQGTAGLVLCAAGLVVERVQVFGQTIELGLFAVPLTVLWLLACINSINLLDGINGLATTIGIVNFLAIAVMASRNGNPQEAVIAAVLAGALLGFLRYNYPHASMFLGDAGSMLSGLLVGVLAVQCSLKAPGTALLAAPVALLAIPFFDSASAIVRRKLTGRSVFSTDRAHLHHRVTERVGSRHAVVVIGVCCGITAVGALASQWLRSDIVAVVSGGSILIAFIATRVFGYSELCLVASRLRATGKSFLVPRQGREAPLESAVRLQGTRPWDHLWDALTQLARDLNLHAVQLDVNAPALHEGFHATWRSKQSDGDVRTWRLDLPLAAAGHSLGHIRVFGEREEGHRSWGVEKLLTMVGSFEEQLAQSLTAEAKLAVLRETVVDLSSLKDTATGIDAPPQNTERPVEQPRLAPRRNGAPLRTQVGALNG